MTKTIAIPPTHLPTHFPTFHSPSRPILPSSWLWLEVHSVFSTLDAAVESGKQMLLQRHNLPVVTGITSKCHTTRHITDKTYLVMAPFSYMALTVHHLILIHVQLSDCN